jgi:hypothetical protein
MLSVRVAHEDERGEVANRQWPCSCSGREQEEEVVLVLVGWLLERPVAARCQCPTTSSPRYEMRAQTPSETKRELKVQQ